MIQGQPKLPLVKLSEGEKILHISRWSKGGMIALMLLVALPLAGFSLLLISHGGEVVGVGIASGLFAMIIYAIAYLSWKNRAAVVTNRNVVFSAGLSKSARTVPLEQINQVTVAPGLVTVRTGSIFNILILRVPDAEVLAETIESARQLR
jgi:hypothetical protein